MGKAYASTMKTIVGFMESHSLAYFELWVALLAVCTGLWT